MLKLDSNAVKVDVNKVPQKSFIEFIQLIQEDTEYQLQDKASSSNLLSEFVSKTIEYYRSQ